MVNIGYDTIRVHKTFHPEQVRELIEPRMTRGRENKLWFNGEFMVFRNPNNCNTFSLQNSFAKYGSETGNNLALASAEMLKECIMKFEHETGLCIGDALVSRLDIAMNTSMPFSVDEGKKLMRDFNRYKRTDRMNTGYMESGEKTLVMYDKKQEMMDNGKTDERMDEGKNLMRLELRIKRHVDKHLGITKEMARLNLACLAEEFGHLCAVRTFEENVNRLLGLRECAHGELRTKQTIEHAAMKKLMFTHSGEMRSLLQKIMRDNDVRNGVREEVMDGYEKKMTRSMGEELRHVLATECDGVYKQYVSGKINKENVDEAIRSASDEIENGRTKDFLGRTGLRMPKIKRLIGK